MEKNSYNVVLTGGAPYLAEYNFNTSAMIRDTISSTLTTETGRDVRVLKYPVDTECNFTSMIEMLDAVWSRNRAVFDADAKENEQVQLNLVVHLGMRESEDCICFESVARKDRMGFRGLDGMPLPAAYTDEGGVWEGLPDVLSPDLPIQAAAEHVQRSFPEIPMRLSNDAGGYFCEFQFWSSLALLAREGKPRIACFVHVPKSNDELAIKNSAMAIEAFIKALVDAL